MATRVTETKYDDLDDSVDGVNTYSLSFDGAAVEIDLGSSNYEALSKALRPYLDAGRKTGGRVRTRRSNSASSAPAVAATSDTAAIRAWAAEHDIKVSSRGRINADVRAQYEAAQK